MQNASSTLLIASTVGLIGLSACETVIELPAEVDTRITSTPPQLTNVATATFEFVAEVDGSELDFQCSVDGSPFSDCVSPYEIEVDEGTHTFRVRGVLVDQVEEPPSSYTWEVDLTPPVTTFTQVPEVLDNSVDAEILFEASESATFSCTLDSAAPTDCTSPWMLTDLADGPHTISVEATDLAGNVELDPPVHSWTIDSSIPDTEIVSGPEGAVSTTTASFTFRSPNAMEPVDFECRLDGSAYETCTSTQSYADLDEGDHAFEVRAFNETGVRDPSPARREWTVDTTPPTVTILTGPPPTSAQRDVSFTFEVGGEPTIIECALGSDPFVDCTSPFDAAALDDGDYEFVVRVRDAAGNEGQDQRSFTVDTTLPDVRITAGPTGPTNDPTPTFEFTVSGTTEPSECRMDDEPYGPCTSPYVSTSLTDGDHTLLRAGARRGRKLRPRPAELHCRYCRAHGDDHFGAR